MEYDGEVTQIILAYKKLLVDSWDAVEPLRHSNLSEDLIDNWLQSSYESFVEALCNVFIKEKMVILDYYGSGTEGLDFFLPRGVEGVPRFSLVGVMPTHTIMCKPKKGKLAKHIMTGEFIDFPSDGYVFGQLMGKNGSTLCRGFDFDIVEIDDDRAPRFSYFSLSDLSFWIREISDDIKK